MTWVITGDSWDAGIYSVKETGFNGDNEHKVRTFTVNESSVTIASDATELSGTARAGKITIGGGTGDDAKTVSNDDVTYYLEEVTAPNGYDKLTKPIAVTVTADGNVVLATTDNDGKVGGVEVDNSSVKSIDWNSPYYTITITNKAGVQLPETGGIGTTIFYIIGGVLIAGATVILILCRRRKS